LHRSVLNAHVLCKPGYPVGVHEPSHVIASFSHETNTFCFMREARARKILLQVSITHIQFSRTSVTGLMLTTLMYKTAPGLQGFQA